MRIGVLTGSGDCPGLNAVIRAVVRVRTCDTRYGSTVVGFLDGWNGLLENRRIQLVSDSRNARLLAKGGTMLGTARTIRSSCGPASTTSSRPWRTTGSMC